MPTRVGRSLVVAGAFLVHILTIALRTPWAHFLWQVLLVLDAALLVTKCLEVLRDLYWVKRHAARYVLRAEHTLLTHGRVEVGAFDRHRRHQPTSWRFGAKYPWAHSLVHLVFRVPILIALCWSLLLRLTWAGPAGVDSVLLAVAAASILMGILTSVLSAIVQRLYYGWFDFHKPEWRINPTAGYTLKLHQLGSVRALGVQASYLIGIMYVTIAGFGAIYYVLYKLRPELFHTAYPIFPLLQMTYFSAVTLATVGYGDVYPREWLSQALVLVQITTGPLFLTLLILSLGGPTTPPDRVQRR